MTNRHSFILLVTAFSLALVEVSGQCTSQADGNWNVAGTWSGCGGGTPGALDNVVIRHLVATTQSEAALSVTVTNSINGQNARLLHSTNGTALTIGTGGLTLTGSNDSGGFTEFAVAGTATATINGNVTITKNNASAVGNYVRFRVGGALAASTSSVTINGDVSATYTNSDNTNYEDNHEINVGNTALDEVLLTINGNTTLTYNFNCVGTDYNQLAFQVSNNSEATLNGDLTLVMTNGGTDGVARLSLEDDATVTITGNVTLDYNDDAATPSLWIELGRSVSPTNTSELTIQGTLILDSEGVNNSLLTNNHNSLDIRGSGHVVLNDIDFRSAGTGLGSGVAGAGQYNGPSIQNRIEIEDNGILEMKGNSLNPIEGSFEYVDTDTKAIFSGISGQQTIPVNLRITGSTNPTSYKNIEINNNSGQKLVIGDRIRTALATTFGIVADGTVTFTNGILTSNVSIGVRKGLTLSNSATTTGGSNTAHVEGTVRKTCSGGSCGDTFFSLGDEGVWAPLEINNIVNEDATTILTVEYAYDPPSNPTTLDATQFPPGPTYTAHASYVEHWNITQTGTTPTVNLTLHWKDACASGIEDVTEGGGQDLFVGHYDGSNWDYLTTSENNITGEACNTMDGDDEVGSITATGVSTFSPFTFFSLANLNTLPVDLLSFEVAKDLQNNVALQWQTASEQNNDFFAVERTQTPEQQWHTIATIKGQGTTQQVTTYTAIDTRPLAGLTYYRLRQQNTDGSFQYSAVKTITLSPNEPALTVHIYPNPATEQVVLESNQSLTGAVVEFVKADGVLYKTIALHNTKTTLDVSDFAEGLYLIRVHTNEGVYQQKIAVQASSH